MPKNLWNDADAAGLTGLDLLVYRSHLLGADRSVCNIYGGNTGSKVMETDFRGLSVYTLWVKGSGSDLATMGRKDFAGLRLDDVLPLMARAAMSDEEMTTYLAHTLLAPNMVRQSIETLLHAFVPAPHTDHTHPDAVISLACAADGERLAREVYGGRMAWVPYIRPGFTLSQWIGQKVRDNPQVECVIMGKHGLVTWGDDPKTCYDHTIRIIQEAEDYITQRAAGRAVFGRVAVPALSAAQRQAAAAEVMPVLRGAAGRCLLAFDDRAEVLDFIGSARAPAVAARGAACPDHLVHTKRVPLFIDWRPEEGIDELKTRLRSGVERYIEDYQAYFAANQTVGDKMGDPAPRIVLIPGVGMFNTGKDAFAANVSHDLYLRAIQVMRGSEAVDRFTSLTPEESYAIEYWPLELYKLTLRPPDRELARRVAFVTGGASGIGRAIAYRLAAEGAHVAVADIDGVGAQRVADDIVSKHGYRRAVAVPCNVSDEAHVLEAFRQTTLAYGGVDIVVSNAGIASSSHITETSLPEWQRLFDVLAQGYFLVSREAFRLWQAQGLGGSLVFVASKNAMIGSKNAAAYGAAKAAEVNLARCLAEDGGALGVRVNVVNPDAVLQGSGIWDAGWREARARGMGIAPERLEEAYRQRCTLKVNVYPEDVAEAVFFLASDRAAKTTGGIVNVDGGIAAAYVR